MKITEYEDGIARFDLYTEAIGEFYHSNNPSHVKFVIEIFTKFTGMIGEFGEFCEKLTAKVALDELIKELSDVEWYLTRLERCLGFTKEEILSECVPDRKYEEMTIILSKFNVWAGKLGEKFKKMIRDKNGQMVYQTPEFVEIFCQLELQLTKIAFHLNKSKEEVLDVNYKKLRDRWERDVLHGSGDKR